MKSYQQYIAENDIKGLLVEMRKHPGVTHGRFSHELNLLSNQWAENEKKYTLNLINNENYQIVRNQTINGLIILADELETGDNPSVLGSGNMRAQSKRSHSWLWGGVVLLSVCVIMLVLTLLGRIDDKNPDAEKNEKPEVELTVNAAADSSEVAAPSPKPVQPNGGTITGQTTNREPLKNNQEQRRPSEQLFSKGDADLNIAWFTDGSANPVAAKDLQTVIARKSGKSIATAEAIFYQKGIKDQLMTGNNSNLLQLHKEGKLLIVLQSSVISKAAEDSGNVFERETSEPSRTLPLEVALFDASGTRTRSIKKTIPLNITQYNAIDSYRAKLVYDLIERDLR